jgi:hypothetical protein
VKSSRAAADEWREAERGWALDAGSPASCHS